jgi:hypothetical protein
MLHDCKFEITQRQIIRPICSWHVKRGNVNETARQLPIYVVPHRVPASTGSGYYFRFRAMIVDHHAGFLQQLTDCHLSHSSA